MRYYHKLDMEFPAQSACVALGLFDGLHPGHVAVIRAAVEEAKRLEKRPCVFTFTNGSRGPEAKGRGKLLSDDMLLSLLEELGVGCVVRPNFADFRDLSPEAFVEEILRKRLGAASVSCGKNFRFGKNAAGDEALLERLCGGSPRVKVIPMVERDGGVVSSSRIREAIEAGEMEAANTLLGRRFAIDFTVVHGRRLGRTLGSPTINQPFHQGFVEPKFGVYATLTRLDGEAYASITNVGIKPTVGSDCVLAETYIHGFSGDLYGQAVRVEFLRFIRPERKFDGIDALKAQILADSGTAAKIVAEAKGAGTL